MVDKVEEGRLGKIVEVGDGVENGGMRDSGSGGRSKRWTGRTRSG